MINNKTIYFVLGLVTIIFLGAFVFFLFGDNVNNKSENTNNNNLGQIDTSSNYDKNICWNRVVEFNGEQNQLFWVDGCKGNPNAEFCTMALVELTQEEIIQYNAWVRDGKNDSILPRSCFSNNNNIESESIFDLKEEGDGSQNIQEPPLLTRDFVSRQTSPSECYVIYRNEVYLIPEDYQKRHPGGSFRITSNCGKDITSEFESSHKKGRLAWNEIEKYKVGPLVD